ncbi:hypothetical protein K469DRAFT_94379 [Zopfia rhizophila CBS 207.26]|uniref:Uncharacterized protein n=1 Tax=Zopfia rhizophila CBS 207.26 TaxID=1314779 RepID=A0A6A6EBB1_9PEZI|nr:hypothetical protein K469DRAFT_94379 [Zopfia rhizophila CBS 207.26]
MALILSTSGLIAQFSVAAKQLEKLVLVLRSRVKSFKEDISGVNMRGLNLAAAESDMDGSGAARLPLPPSTMGNLLTHVFDAARGAPKQPDVLELRGSTGYFDITTIMLWLTPEKMVLGLSRSEVHPTSRKLVIGTAVSPLLIQAGSDGFEYDVKGNEIFGWRKVEWSSVKTLTLSAVGWADVARPLVSGSAGFLGGVALSAMRNWLG